MSQAEPEKSSDVRHPGYSACPGCKRAMLAHLLACRRCWARTPRTLRDAVVRSAGREVLVLAFAWRDVVLWLREHPQKQVQRGR